MLNANKNHMPELIEKLRSSSIQILLYGTKSSSQSTKTIFSYMSNGFKDFIVPIVEEYGIHSAENVFANEFTYDSPTGRYYRL